MCVCMHVCVCIYVCVRVYACVRACVRLQKEELRLREMCSGQSFLLFVLFLSLLLSLVHLSVPQRCRSCKRN